MVKVKKLVAMLLTLSMLMSLLVLPAKAADGISVSVSNATISAGGTMKVDVNVDSNPGFGAMTISVGYKTSILTVNSINVAKASDGTTTAWKANASAFEDEGLTVPVANNNKKNTAVSE